MAPPSTPEELLRLTAITKRYPGALALDRVSLEIKTGEVHALFGENGAGKSTLIGIVTGIVRPDAGQIRFTGNEVRLTPHRARSLGIGAVFQEFSLAPDLTVEENLFLGREVARHGILQRSAMRERARAGIASLGFDLDLRARTGSLPRAQQQMAEIAKALLAGPRLLILDEPTASLSERETEVLFALLRRLRGEGVGIVYVSHRMAEIRALADRITVLRDGRRVATVAATEADEAKLIELMAGRKLEALYPAIIHKPGEVLLSVVGLRSAGGTVEQATLHARMGEIVGIAGLVGCGKGEVLRTIFGLEARAGGEVELFGRSVARPTPRTMLRAGVTYFPSDRVAEGLALNRPVRENISMAALDRPDFARAAMLLLRAERRRAWDIAGRLHLRPLDIERPVGSFSGGNRQKAVLARGFARPTRIFLFDEPTVGIDVAAKREVYDLIAGLVADGAAVVIASSDLAELLHLCHRLYVMRDGRTVAELPGGHLEESDVLPQFFGLEHLPALSAAA